MQFADRELMQACVHAMRLHAGDCREQSRIHNAADGELMDIAKSMLAAQHYKLSPDGAEAFAAYIAERRRRPLFANARSIRNALDRARLRHASRYFEQDGPVRLEDLMTIDAADILTSRVFDAENSN